MFGWCANSELALGPFDADLAVGDLDLDPAGNGDRLFPDTRHDDILLNRLASGRNRLPNVAEQLAAQALGTGLAIAHDAPAGADDGNPRPSSTG